MVTVEIVIDELVLHGFDVRDRYRVADALERQLTEAFASQSAESLQQLVGPDRSIGDVVAPAVTLPRDDGRMADVLAGSVSAAVARAVAGVETPAAGLPPVPAGAPVRADGGR